VAAGGRQAGCHRRGDRLGDAVPAARLRQGSGDQPFGTTTDVAQALATLPAGLPVTAILGELDTPIATAATDIIDLSYADERSVVQTRFPTSLLTLLRTHLGESRATVADLVSRARAVTRTPREEPAPRQLVVLGSGWAAALAQEGALKCRESVGMWAEAYAHGGVSARPISVAGPGTLVWAMTPLTDVQTRAISGTGHASTMATTTRRSSSWRCRHTRWPGPSPQAGTPTCPST
jgi:glucosamine 6-phosphate synthetase-like amidotransferase/phosphosugar isomerase protein